MAFHLAIERLDIMNLSHFLWLMRKIGAIVFNPLKRFSFPVTIHFEVDDEDKITSVYVRIFTVEVAPKDSVDQLMRRLRF